MTLDIRREEGCWCWGLYVDGVRTIDREALPVVERVRDALLGRDLWPSEADEVAESIRRWRSGWEAMPRD